MSFHHFCFLLIFLFTVLYDEQPANMDVDCLVTLANKTDIRHQHQQHLRQSHTCVGIQLESLADACPVISILLLAPLRTIAVGQSDGRMILYSLAGGNSALKAYHLAHPPEPDAPLVRLAYIEPADDPRAFVYLWAFHATAKMAIAVMHSVAFASKHSSAVNSPQQSYVYRHFQSCKSVLTMPIFATHSFPISMQAIGKLMPYDDDNVLSLCLLAWTARKRTHVIVFDLNQWYKAEMPMVCDWREQPNYVAVFPLELSASGGAMTDAGAVLDVWMNPKTVAPFGSVQRPEEHFYPSSLNFGEPFIFYFICLLFTNC